MTNSLIQNYQGVFDGNLGFGSRPALLLVDFVRAYTTPGSALYAPDVAAAAQETVSLLYAARLKQIPVVYTKVLYNPNFKDGGLFVRKIPALKMLVAGEPLAEIVPELLPTAEDLIIIKQYASAFFGTSLAASLTSMKVDTLLLTGCSTSGCMRFVNRLLDVF